MECIVAFWGREGGFGFEAYSNSKGSNGFVMAAFFLVWFWGSNLEVRLGLALWPTRASIFTSLPPILRSSDPLGRGGCGRRGAGFRGGLVGFVWGGGEILTFFFFKKTKKTKKKALYIYIHTICGSSL